MLLSGATISDVEGFEEEDGFWQPKRACLQRQRRLPTAEQGSRPGSGSAQMHEAG